MKRWLDEEGADGPRGADRERTTLPWATRSAASASVPLPHALHGYGAFRSRLHNPPESMHQLEDLLHHAARIAGDPHPQPPAALASLILHRFSHYERVGFFNVTLRHICSLAARTPELFGRAALPRLCSGTAAAFSLTDEQCACLLANAFFGLFGERPGRSKLPSFTMSHLHRVTGEGGAISRQNEQKWRCLLGYFERLATSSPSTGRLITFERVVLDTSELDLRGGWGGCRAALCRLECHATGSIENPPPLDDALQLDFANRFIGGGVLRRGCVQEEIRFLVCPELIVSCLFTEVMADNEAVLIRGFERYSSYSGYSASFVYAGHHFEPLARAGETARPPTTLLAIDAVYFRRDARARQWEELMIQRELNKAYAGFSDEGRCEEARAAQLQSSSSSLSTDRRPGVRTGNWGCGAFGGDVQLKAIVQLLAASRAQRSEVAFLSFGDADFASALQRTWDQLAGAGATVGEVAQWLALFAPDRWPKARVAGMFDLFGYLMVKAQDMAAAGPKNPKLAPGTHTRMFLRSVCGTANVPLRPPATIVGRATPGVIASPYMSREHARFQQTDDGTWTLQALGQNPVAYETDDGTRLSLEKSQPPAAVSAERNIWLVANEAHAYRLGAAASGEPGQSAQALGGASDARPQEPAVAAGARLSQVPLTRWFGPS